MGAASEIRNVYPKCLVFVLIAALVTIALWPAFESPATPGDEGTTLVYPEMFSKGRLPYRDFDTMYGPGNILILSAVYAGFGTNIFVERAVGLIYRLLILLAIFGIVQRWGIIVAFGCTFLTAVLLGSTEVWANSWIGAVAFALCALWAMADVKSGRRCFVAGVLGGIALLCRCDFGPALIASVLPLFLSMNPSARYKFLGGESLALLPLLWLSVVAGPAQLVYSIFTFPVFHLSWSGYLPISAASGDVLCLLYLHVGASVLNVGAGLVELRAARSPRAWLLLGTALLGAGSIHYAWWRPDSGHVLNAALVSLALIPLSIFVLFSATAKTFPSWIKSAAAIIIVIAAIHLLLPRFTLYFYRGLRVGFHLESARQVSKMGEQFEPGDKGVFVKRNERSFPLGTTGAARVTDNMLAELDRVTVPGQRLFVGPGDLRRTNYCDSFIYHMLPQLQPATYFLEMNPGSANAPHSRLAQDVATADWLVLNHNWDLLDEPNGSRQFGPDTPNQVVQEKFDRWAEIGPYFLFRNKKLRNAVMLPPAP
ncbi:MAG: hypothetical protein ABJB69_04025 [Spartobacteria bacterium]